MGGGGLYSVGRDYLTFLQMLLNDGTFNGAQVLRPETVAEMNRNQLGDLPVTVMKTSDPGRARTTPSCSRASSSGGPSATS